MVYNDYITTCFVCQRAHKAAHKKKKKKKKTPKAALAMASTSVFSAGEKTTAV